MILTTVIALSATVIFGWLAYQTFEQVDFERKLDREVDHDEVK